MIAQWLCALVLLVAATACDAAADTITGVVWCTAHPCLGDSVCIESEGKMQCMPTCTTDDECGTGYMCCDSAKTDGVCGLESECTQ